MHMTRPATSPDTDAPDHRRSKCRACEANRIGFRITFSIFSAAVCLALLTEISSAQTPQVYRDRVEPHWFANNTMFWYRVRLPRNQSEFVLVDVQKRTRVAAFDHAAVAQAISKETSKQVTAGRLPIQTLEFSSDGSSITLKGRTETWHLDRMSGAISLASKQSQRPKETAFFMPARKSIDRGGDVELQLVNQLKENVQLIWMGRDGNPVSYGRVDAGAERTQHTFVGHIWLLKSEGGKSLACFEAFPGRNQIVISEEALEKTKTIRPQSPKPAPPRRTRPGRAPAPRVAFSPDRKFSAEVQDHNLHLVVNTGGDSRNVQLSSDATEENSFQKDASRARLVQMQYGLQDPPSTLPDVRWSPKSEVVVAFQTKRVPERRVYYVESTPRDQLQPRLQSYPYAKPGDPIPVSWPRLFRLPDGDEIPVSRDLFPNPFQLSFQRWSDDGERFYLLYNERGHQNVRVLEVNTADGAVRAIVDEHSSTFIQYSDRGKFVMEWLPDNQLLWASERSGWNHLYRYDVADGKVINAVTSGDWNMKRIERIDRDRKVIWFYAVGVKKDQDPYHEHFCCVNFDGSGFQVLTEGDGTHQVQFSPDRKYLIDRWSRVDHPPVTELRTVEGAAVVTLETADASEVKAVRPLPIRFTAKGRDGQTDIWGIIHLPLNYDPTRKYPVVENIYAGPHDHHVPKAFRTRWRHQHQIADRGIIVVQIDGMGTGWRSKKFHDVCYRNLRDAGFPDRIAWMKSAAKKFTPMDLSRVGIYGGSAGGQNAMAALLWHGAFYKAAVADCGCHDNRMDKIWWNEQWMGVPGDGVYAANSNSENAYRLQGNLMLVVGELDRNVDPASTMQVVSKLVRANKDFDFLIVPGAGHGACEGPYGSRRRADFLARHLGAGS